MNSSEDRIPANDPSARADVRHLVRDVFNEFVVSQTQRTEPAHKAELEEEKRRREGLERRLNELVEENRRSKALAESLERETQVKTELQKQGVTKVDLAYRALKDDLQREKDGSLTVRCTDGIVPVKDAILHFLDQNPEFLPPRNLGGSGVGSSPRSYQNSPGIDLDSIKPGMSAEDMARARREIARLAGHLDQ